MKEAETTQQVDRGSNLVLRPGAQQPWASSTSEEMNKGTKELMQTVYEMQGIKTKEYLPILKNITMDQGTWREDTCNYTG